MSAKSKIKHFVVGILVLLVLLIAALLIFPGRVVKSTVNTAGPAVLGVDVKLEDAIFRLLRGKAELRRLHIGNPEGFDTPSLCEAETIRVKVKPGSLTSDTIVIEEIYLDAPVFTYQKALTKSNLSTLLDNLKGDKEPKKEKNEKPRKDGGKKVIIEDLKIENAKVVLSVKGLESGTTLVLPTIHLTDIGKKSGGATATEVVEEVFGLLLSTITRAATKPLEALSKGTDVITDTAKDSIKLGTDAANKTLKGAGDGVKKLTGGLKGLIKKKD